MKLRALSGCLLGCLLYSPQVFAQQCIQGYVWREATRNDRVCVTPATRQQARDDNAQTDARREPGGGSFGFETCKQGYVWREATSSDHVCVTPQTRDQARYDNSQARARVRSQRFD